MASRSDLRIFEQLMRVILSEAKCFWLIILILPLNWHIQTLNIRWLYTYPIINLISYLNHIISLCMFFPKNKALTMLQILARFQALWYKQMLYWYSPILRQFFLWMEMPGLFLFCLCYILYKYIYVYISYVYIWCNNVHLIIINYYRSWPTH